MSVTISKCSLFSLTFVLIHICLLACGAKAFCFFRLTEVSPLLRDSLASPSSLEYICSLTSELKLEVKDLHNLVQLFKPCVTSQT